MNDGDKDVRDWGSWGHSHGNASDLLDQSITKPEPVISHDNLDGLNEGFWPVVSEFLLCTGKTKECSECCDAFFRFDVGVHSNCIIGVKTCARGEAAKLCECIFELERIPNVGLLSKHDWLKHLIDPFTKRVREATTVGANQSG